MCVCVFMCVGMCVRVFMCVPHAHYSKERDTVCVRARTTERVVPCEIKRSTQNTQNAQTTTTYHTCSSGELSRPRCIFGSQPAPTSKLARATQRRAKVRGALITPTFYILDHHHYHDANCPRWGAPSCRLNSYRQEYGQIPTPYTG